MKKITLIASIYAILSTTAIAQPLDDQFKTLTGQWKGDSRPSIFLIKKNRTGTNRTEVHIKSSVSNFQNYSLQVGTGLHETGKDFDFLIGDYDGDGISDIWAIKKWGTGTKHTEVHIMSGKSNYQEFVLHGITPLEETGDNFQFLLEESSKGGSFIKPELIAIKQSGTGTHSTEIHTLSGISDYQQFSGHTGTALHETSKDWQFAIGEWKDSGSEADLIAFSPAKGGEVHVLSGANYMRFIDHRVVNNTNYSELLGVQITKQEEEVLKACDEAGEAFENVIEKPLRLSRWVTAHIKWQSCREATQKYNDDKVAKQASSSDDRHHPEHSGGSNSSNSSNAGGSSSGNNSSSGSCKNEFGGGGSPLGGGNGGGIKLR